MVRETGLEPVRDYHTPLKRARLPIPPLSHIFAVSVSLSANDIIANTLDYVNIFFEKIENFCFDYTTISPSISGTPMPSEA